MVSGGLAWSPGVSDGLQWAVLSLHHWRQWRRQRPLETVETTGDQGKLAETPGDQGKLAETPGDVPLETKGN